MENTVETKKEEDSLDDFYTTTAASFLEYLLNKKREEINQIQDDLGRMDWNNVGNNSDYCNKILEAIELIEKDKYPGLSRSLIMHCNQMKWDLQKWINKYYN